MPTATAGQTSYVDPNTSAATNQRPMAASATTKQAVMPRPLGVTSPSAPMTQAMNTRPMVSSRTNVPQVILMRSYVTAFFPTSVSVPRPRSLAGLLYPAQG